MNELIIAGVTIIQDEHGRYNLNALHQAAITQGMIGEADVSKVPFRWTRLKNTTEIIAELQGQAPDLVLETVHGGDRRGTYAHVQSTDRRPCLAGRTHLLHRRHQ